MPYYHVDNNLSKTWGINSNLDRFLMDYLCEPIDDDKD